MVSAAANPSRISVPRQRRRSPRWTIGTWFGACTVLVVLFGAAFAPLFAAHDPTQANILDKLTPPMERGLSGAIYPLGTDSVGRDILSRVLFGARVSLLVGFAAVAVAGTVGVFLGVLSGYYGGWLDDVVMRIADIQLAFPVILLAIALLAVAGPGLQNIIVVLAIVGWVPYARVVRVEALALRDREFVQSARVIGVGDPRILSRHVLPNLLAPVMVIASFAVANTILAEASLSFLGLGVDPSTPSWGGMLADSRDFLLIAWWPATWPGLALLIAVLGINILGDSIRDLLDPRLRV